MTKEKFNKASKQIDETIALLLKYKTTMHELINNEKTAHLHNTINTLHVHNASVISTTVFNVISNTININ